MQTIRRTQNSLQPIRIINNFYSKAPQLRNDFEQVFENPLHANTRRFCWDYWNVPNQYRLLRTPAESFFPRPHFQAFLEHLLQWGRQNLGCQMISRPWLSSYVNDCYQELHSDVPHGPWSFVYSLTPRSYPFTGGETLVSKPKLLHYFQNHDSAQSDEHSSFFHSIRPSFNRLVVFDPRYPHGVSRVNGVNDLLDSRLVIHGWFTEPRPMIEGSLAPKQCMKSMDQFAEPLMNILVKKNLTGILSLRLHINSSGKIASLEVLTAHLVSSESGSALSSASLNPILKPLLIIRFPKSSGSTRITLPIEVKQ